MIELLVLDVDGVLTDGGLYYGADGEVLKRFNVKDGQGVAMLREAGVVVAIISGRGNAALASRAGELGIDHLRVRIADKGAALRALQAELGIAADATAAMGDDLPDLAMFGEAALRLAPADAEAEILAQADHVTARAGGHGAVRDAADFILRRNAEAS